MHNGYYTVIILSSKDPQVLPNVGDNGQMTIDYLPLCNSLWDPSIQVLCEIYQQHPTALYNLLDQDVGLSKNRVNCPASHVFVEHHLHISSHIFTII